jgi:hypothetical protein
VYVVVILLPLRDSDHKMDRLALMLMTLYEYDLYLKIVSDYNPPWRIALVHGEVWYSGRVC